MIKTDKNDYQCKAGVSIRTIFSNGKLKTQWLKFANVVYFKSTV